MLSNAKGHSGRGEMTRELPCPLTTRLDCTYPFEHSFYENSFFPKLEMR
jgi:hypothetical protein